MYFMKALLALLSIFVTAQANSLRTTPDRQLVTVSETVDLTVTSSVSITTPTVADIVCPVTGAIIHVAGKKKDLLKGVFTYVAEKVECKANEGIHVVTTSATATKMLVIDLGEAVANKAQEVAIEVKCKTAGTIYAIYSASTELGQKALCFTGSALGLVSETLGAVVDGVAAKVSDLKSRRFLFVEATVGALDLTEINIMGYVTGN